MNPASVPGGAAPVVSPFRRWLDRRIPPGNAIVLDRRNIFIFPTPFGLAFAGLLVLLLLGGINYQASLVLGVVFLLGSLFLVTIVATFRNLSGLRLELIGVRPVFAGETLAWMVRATGVPGNRRARAHVAIRMGWPRQPMQWLAIDAEAPDRLPLPARRRGWLQPGRVVVETTWPFGLLRAWSWIDFARPVLVYPQPIFDSAGDVSAAGKTGRSRAKASGQDELDDVRDYRPGDRPRDILWRSYARGGALVTAQRVGPRDDIRWLDLARVPGDTEARLSRLTGQALEASRAGLVFGLRLGATMVPPGQGDAHLHRVLARLALHGAIV